MKNVIEGKILAVLFRPKSYRLPGESQISERSPHDRGDMFRQKVQNFADCHRLDIAPGVGVAELENLVCQNIRLDKLYDAAVGVGISPLELERLEPLAVPSDCRFGREIELALDAKHGSWFGLKEEPKPIGRFTVDENQLMIELAVTKPDQPDQIYWQHKVVIN